MTTRTPPEMGQSMDGTGTWIGGLVAGGAMGAVVLAMAAIDVIGVALPSLLWHAVYRAVLGVTFVALPDAI